VLERTVTDSRVAAAVDIAKKGERPNGRVAAARSIAQKRPCADGCIFVCFARSGWVVKQESHRADSGVEVGCAVAQQCIEAKSRIMYASGDT
jgi:hypothetical protein